MVSKKKVAKLPKQQLLILSICRFSEPLAMSSVYPYLPEMIQSFDVPTDKVAKWAGLMQAIFSFSQSLTGIAWGGASDRFGRKPMIMIALTSTMISGVMFGFSKNLAWAFTTRAFQGLSNGNVGILRTTVAELVPQKELQPRAFSIMPLVWTVGSIFGPSIGGSLVHPVERFPGIFGTNKLLTKYPYALPNLLISAFFLIGITSGMLFLRETLETKKSKRDYGLLIGSFLTKPFRKPEPKRHSRADSAEAVPFLDDTAAELSSPTVQRSSAATTASKPAKVAWSEVFNTQSDINLAAYTFLAMHSVAYDQLLPIFMHHPVQSRRDSKVNLPLQFAGGFGIDSERIGLLFTIYGIFGMIIQFAIFPPFARRYGILNCFKACAVAFPLVYVATPFTSLLPSDNLRQGVMLGLMLFKGFFTIFAFPCSTILLTNSAASLRVLGTLNGVATSISALGRAAGPALSGATFTIGVNMGYIIMPWWFLALVAMIGAIPIWFLVEMEGFGGGNSQDTNEDGEQDTDDRHTGAEQDGLDGTTTASSPQDNQIRRTAAANIILGTPIDEPEDVPADTELALERSQTAGSGRRLTRPRSSTEGQRLPSPIGLKSSVRPQGSRTYSSDLGISRSGLGTGGTAYH